MENKTFFLESINSLCPNCQFTLYDEDYEQLIWIDKNPIPKPTLEEIEAEMQRLQTEYEHNNYQRLRAKEYPSFADQFDLLYHGGYDAWKVEIDKVKQKYPKP